MSTFSERMQEVASRLLTNYGEAITFTRWATNGYNVTTGSVDPVSSTTYTAYGHPRAFINSEVDGTIIQQNDLEVLLYSTSAPEIDDTAVIDNNTFRVMSVSQTRAQGDVVLYRLQLRK